MRVIDITEEVEAAKKSVLILPTGLPEEPWEDYIDFKQYRLDYDYLILDGVAYTTGKYGLGGKLSLPDDWEDKI